MLLLTGATGRVGSALLTRVLAAGLPVRCLVRDPRRLRGQRVRVQIALGDLADPPSFRNALRGVDTVVHLAGSIRDQAVGSIEELNAIATWRMVQAAERAGAERFLLLSPLNASTHHRARFFRAKALAERAVGRSELATTVLATSLVYAGGDQWLTLLARLAVMPVVPVPGRGQAACQPIWAEDVAECVMGALGRDGVLPAAQTSGGDRSARHERFELAGPQTLNHDQIIEIVLRSLGRRRPLVHLPAGVARRTLQGLEALVGSRALATWDEAELLQVPMLSVRGATDAHGLGVSPRAMGAVLGTR